MKGSKVVAVALFGTIVTSLIGPGVMGQEVEDITSHLATAPEQIARPVTKPAAFKMAGSTFEIKVASDQWESYHGRLKESAAGLLEQSGATAVWDYEGIVSESRERDSHEGSRWVAPETLHPERTVWVAQFVFELTALLASKRDGGSFELGRWFSGVRFDLRNDRVYAGLIARVRNKRTGEILRTFKVMESARSIDRAGAQILGG
ncbi:MAG: hypothetical protein AAB499_01090, partial [Patescibacteria group bacterium]